MSQSGQPQRSRDAFAVSVVIPLYNHARYIEACLDSLLRQTAPAEEIILVDDGSSDQGFRIAEAKLRGVPGARVYSQANAGAHAALNRAIDLAQNPYVAVLNSDDLFHATKLERCRALLRETPDVSFIAGRLAIIDDDGRRLNAGATIDWLKRADRFFRKTGMRELSLLNENYICTTSNMVFARDLWREIGGFQALRYCHDLDFAMSAFRQGRCRFDETSEHISYRVHTANTIKEALEKIHVEIAAVLARALADEGPRILTSRGELDVPAFAEFVENKDISGLLCYFLAVSGAFPTRQEFYAHATTPALHPNFTRLLRSTDATCR